MSKITNKSKHGNFSSQWKGAYKVGNRWKAAITVQNRSVHLGYFNSEKDAALAYNEAALEYFGEFAKLNEMDAIR